MRTVEPAKPRATVSETPEGLRIVVPARRHLLPLLFLPLWLCAWAAGLLAVSATLLFGSGAGGPPQLFMLVWLAGWTAGGLFALYQLLWMLVGREIVTVEGSVLAQQRKLFGWARGQRFDLRQVRDLRVGPAPFDPWSGSAGWRYWGVGNGTIAFDYGARTYRFADSLDEAEAKAIVQTIVKRFPQLQEQS